MRILLVTPLYPPDLGSLAFYCKELAKRLSETQEIALLTYGSHPEQIPGVTIHFVPKNIPIVLRVIKFTIRLWREAKNNDVLLVSDGASVGLPAFIVHWLRGIPYIRQVTEDESWERAVHTKKTEVSEQDYALVEVKDQKIKWIRRLQRLVLSHAARILVPTPLHQDIFAHAYHLERTKIDCLAYPIEQQLAFPFEREPQPFQLVITSSVARHQGIEEILIALITLKQRFPQIRLILANDGPDTAYFQTQAQQCGLEETVRFLGFVSNVERQYLLETSGIFLCLHGRSHGPREIYLAYRHHIPVIATEVFSHPEVILDQHSGLTVPAKNVPALEQAITHLFEDRSLRTNLIAAGNRCVETHVSWEHHLSRIYKTCHDAISATPYGTH